MWRNKPEDQGQVPRTESGPAPIQITPDSSLPGQATRVSKSVTIKGEVSGNEDLFLDGEVQGNIRLGEAEITVGPSGRVTADIHARSILVEGSVQGKLEAKERVRLGRSATVNGEIISPRLAIEEGAVFRGKVEIAEPGPARSSSRAAAASVTNKPAPVQPQRDKTP